MPFIYNAVIPIPDQQTVILQTTTERSAQYARDNVQYVVGGFKSSLIFLMTLVLVLKKKILLLSTKHRKKAFPVSFMTALQFLTNQLVVMNAGSNFLKLPWKAQEEDKEKQRDLLHNAAKEISLGGSSSIFFFFELYGIFTLKEFLKNALKGFSFLHHST